MSPLLLHASNPSCSHAIRLKHTKELKAKFLQFQMLDGGQTHQPEKVHLHAAVRMG